MPYGAALLWYADVDEALGGAIEERLLLKGVNVSSNSGRMYTVSPHALNSARYVIVIVTQSAAADDDEMAVCSKLVALAAEREKPVFSLVEDDLSAYHPTKVFAPPSFTSNTVTIPLRLHVLDNHSIAITSALYWLFASLDAYEERQRLYDTLSTMAPNVFHGQYSDQYADHVERVLQCIQRELRHVSTRGARKSLIKEALGCAESLARVGARHDEVGMRSADIRLNCLSILASLRDSCREMSLRLPVENPDPLFYAIAIRLIYLDICIRGHCADALTNGDVTEIGDPTRANMASEQDEHYEMMLALLDGISREQFQQTYDAVEQRLISTTEDLLLSRHIWGSMRYESLFTRRPQPLETLEEQGRSDASQETLVAIAHCILESNQLFDQFVEPDTPTSFLVSLRTSYERLSQYCVVIGASELRVDLLDRIGQINQLIEMGKGDEAPTATRAPVSGIRSLLGLDVSATRSFDAFISYSHDDEDVAFKVYRFLKESLREPFFDRMSLPEMSDSDYEEAIMNALDRSKNLVLVLSDLAALESRWIRLEVKTFLHEVTEGRKPDGNVLLVVSEDVWNAIAASNKTCLPIRLRSSEILKMGSYRSTLLSYL